ncbi:MAG: sulfite exporter TauE/SafE family protein [Parcubacteria group bacterium]
MKKYIYVQGMHCASCEKILEDDLQIVSGARSIKADCKRGIVEIVYDKVEPDSEVIKKIIQKCGYQAVEKKAANGAVKKAGLNDWLSAILVALMVLLGIRIIQSLGLVPSLGSLSNPASLGVSLLIGLTASVSSCLAVVGGVIIAFSEKYQTDEKSFWRGAAKPNIFFHIGRAGAFFLLGGLLGLLGGQINISGNFLSLYTIFIAVVMFLLALNILGFAPALSSFGVTMPKGLTRHWSALKDSNHKAAPFVLGALSFFLPCGFTQSMQLFALASGSFWTGGLVLLFFALGTLPVLLALGITVSWTKNRHTIIFQKAAGMLVLLFALYTLNSGLALSGMKGNILSTDNSILTVEDNASEKNNAPPAAEDTNTQVIRTTLSSAGFDPSTIKIKKGVPVKWIINGDHATGCTDKIIIPSLNITQSIHAGDNVVTFTPGAAGEIPFSCWMGMVRGKFIVE